MKDKLEECGEISKEKAVRLADKLTQWVGMYKQGIEDGS